MNFLTNQIALVKLTTTNKQTRMKESCNNCGYEKPVKAMLNNLSIRIITKWVPHGVEVERWLCNPRVSGSIAGNLEKLFIWTKIHGITQKQTVTELYSLQKKRIITNLC